MELGGREGRKKTEKIQATTNVQPLHHRQLMGIFLLFFLSVRFYCGGLVDYLSEFSGGLLFLLLFSVIYMEFCFVFLRQSSSIVPAGLATHYVSCPQTWRSFLVSAS